MYTCTHKLTAYVTLYKYNIAIINIPYQPIIIPADFNLGQQISQKVINKFCIRHVHCSMM